MRVSRASEERRQEILDAAMQVFYLKGYEKATIRDIALDIGVAQGLIYRYFKSKEALFAAALDNYAERLAGEMGQEIRNDETALRDKILNTPSFYHIEDDDSYYYKMLNGPDSKGIYQQLSLKVAERLVPIVRDAIAVYGQLGVLFREDLSGNQKVDRIRKFVSNQIY